MLNRKDAVELINKWDKSDNLRGNANKAQFTKLYDIVKVKEGRDATIELLVSVIDEIKLNSRRKEFKATLKQVVAFVDYNTVVNYEKVDYNNIKLLCNFINYVDKAELIVDIKKVLEVVYSSKQTIAEYNNELGKALTKLKADNKVEVVVKSITIERALIQADSMTVEVKTALLERLMVDLGYSIEEVA